MGLTRDHVVWAYRILLDRDPESEDVILPKMRGYQNTRDLRNDIVTSAEYQEKNRDYAQMNERTLVIREIAPGLAESSSEALRSDSAASTSPRAWITFARRSRSASA